MAEGLLGRTYSTQFPYSRALACSSCVSCICLSAPRLTRDWTCSLAMIKGAYMRRFIEFRAHYCSQCHVWHYHRTLLHQLFQPPTCHSCWEYGGSFGGRGSQYASSFHIFIFHLKIMYTVTSLAAGRFGDMVGRKGTLFTGAVIFTVGGGIQTFSSGFYSMIIGRIVSGFGVGLLS